MCIVTREVMDEAELIRFARSPDGDVVPDPARKLPGRGVWVSLARTKVAEAMKRRLFAKGFDAHIKDDPALPETTAQALRRAALGLLGMAKKAGALVAGSTKTADLLAKGRARIVLHASEAAEDGKRKLDRLAAPETAILGCFSGTELDLALGRENVIHAAVIQGGLAERLLSAARRVERYDAR